ncbi:hypothetical protein niasHT_022757 [Heterodera trifolii]|uniref:Transmembrane protein n=1 Tax=Heterodera trifolii TaxID=157864 RepID=A0ABD2K6N4_9BILA
MAGEKQQQQQKKQNELRRDMTMLGRAIVTAQNARDEAAENDQQASPEYFNEIAQRFENSEDRSARAWLQKMLSKVEESNEKARMEDKERIAMLEGELKMTKQMLLMASVGLLICAGAVLFKHLKN